MKTTTIIALSLLAAGPALAHPAGLPHAHAEASLWPLLIGCVAIAGAALLYVRQKPARQAGKVAVSIR